MNTLLKRLGPATEYQFFFTWCLESKEVISAKAMKPSAEDLKANDEGGAVDPGRRTAVAGWSLLTGAFFFERSKHQALR